MDYVPDHAETAPSHFEYSTPIDKNIAAEWKQQAFLMMDYLTGWCSKQKGGILFDLVIKNRPKVIVEIGVWGGKSLVPMAVGLKANGDGVIYGIDPWKSSESVMWIQEETSKEWWTTVDHEGVLQELIEKITLFDLEEEIQLIRATSEEAPAIEQIDILHIDGNHSEETSYFDVTKWAPLVRKGGWIIFDDMSWSEKGKNTTGRAVDWLNNHCIKMAEFSDEALWGIWIKQ